MKKAWIAAAFGAVGALLLRARSHAAPVTLGDYVRGCEDYVSPARLTPAEQEGFRRMTPYVRLVWAVTGKAHIRGWYRPSECNRRRGGAARSRHVAGYAVDMDLAPAQTDKLLAKLREIGAVNAQGSVVNASAWGDYVRRNLGISEKVGFKIYPSGNIHIDLGCPPGTPGCDPRRADWLVVEV